MKRSFKNRKTFLAFCLSALMLTSATALASCKDGSGSTDSSSSSSSSSVTSTVKDTGLITNSNFETDLIGDTKPMITSVTSWTRTVVGNAVSSKAASGTIDTSTTAWNELTTSYYSNPDDVKSLTEDQAKDAWKNLTTRDKLAYYEAWKDANPDKNIGDLSFYESFNIELKDIPTVNPGVPTGTDEDDTNVLMIHNQNPASTSSSTYKTLGTAQKFTSGSTVTVPAGASAQISVWVKTAELKSSATDGSSQDAIGKGAFINLTHSVGGTSLPDYQITNIATDNWKQYTLYVRGSSYVDTTFSLVLGLGQEISGRIGYVNGYAFFDNIECELIDNDTFDEKTTDVEEKYIADFASEKEDKIIDTYKDASATVGVLDFHDDFTASALFTGIDNFDRTGDAIATPKDYVTEEEGYSSLEGSTLIPLGLNGGFNADKDVIKVYANEAAMKAQAELKNGEEYANKYLYAVYEDYFKDNAFSTDKEVFLLLSSKGVAYTATTQTPIAFADYEIEPGVPAEYLAISVFVKTSDMHGKTGAALTIVDHNNKTSFESIDTSDIAPVKLGDNEDVYEGWQQYFFFVERGEDTSDDISFNLSFSFGPTTIDGNSKASDYSSGFAAFTTPTIRAMSQKEYDSVKAGTYAKTVTIKGDQADKAAGNSGFDTSAITPSDALEKGLANLKNYKGVYSGSDYVTSAPSATGTNVEVNKNANAGLLNKENFTKSDGIFNTLAVLPEAEQPAWFKGIYSTAVALGATDAKTGWDKVAGSDTTQPLLIWNTEAQAYGFIGNSTEIAANTYAAVSVRVKVSANATANVYLIDTSDTSYQKTLSVGRNLTYWYDNDGNICDSDPTASGFNARTDVAFYLQSNGLYLVNKNWTGKGEIPTNRYYANLANYEKDEAGNLVIADKGISHAYSDAWDNAGVVKEVYYKGTENYYTYTNGAKTDVYDLASITNLARYSKLESANEQGMHFTVENTNGKWKTVTFYVHTGINAKNYRLEVWSGSRDGATKSAANSYVLFDTNTAANAETYFPTLTAQYKESILAKYENKIENVPASEMFYGVFSFYDSNTFRRYDASLDENKVGNEYEKSFVPSENAEGIAYLSYKDETENVYSKFIDYSLSEQEVAKTVEEETDTETDEEKDDNGTNIWLLVSSISIAAILLLAVISLIIRKIVKKHRKKSGSKARQEVAAKAKKSKKK